jgi:hypothetical protein
VAGFSSALRISQCKHKKYQNQGELSVTFIRLSISLILLTILTIVAMGQNPSSRENQDKTTVRSSINRLSENIKIAPAAGTPVSGSGTPGQLVKWTGVDGSNSYSLGNSLITEDKFGKVGIGTTTPTSKLTVQGMIETTLGGYKFPDGTVQTTAANGLQSIFRDTTLKGNGTQGSPLGIAVPLTLSGSALYGTIVSITNTANGGSALTLQAGDNPDSAPNGAAGDAMTAKGGNATNAAGGYAGYGVIAYGGHNASSNEGGAGLFTQGGISMGQGGQGGRGLIAVGGYPHGIGVLGFGGDAVGAGTQTGIAIYGQRGQAGNGATEGPTGYFAGNVEVFGNFNVIGGGSKNFKIDHPLDPENKYLYHAAIESSEVLNVYSGNVTTDGNGEATVTLPEWFESINKDFRYQLTVVGTFAQAIVGNKIKDNHFTIKTNAANIEVSWQVTGVRSDAAILKHPFKLEENKPQAERGSYLTPDAYNQPEERGIEWVRNPQMMREIKQQRTEPGQGKQQKPVNR